MIQPRSSSGGGKSREELIGDIAMSIEEKMPKPFDEDAIGEKFPTDYNESMNTVLCQEVGKYNRLIHKMIEMLADIKKALVGDVVMSEELEGMGNAMFDNLVPSGWADVGFLSLKPLASWMSEMLVRVDFLQKWIDNGTPSVYWISGFFFPQAFLTATLQNYARKHVIAIDELSFEFKIYDEVTHQEITEKPEDGAFCYGMYVEGARWNDTIHLLDDSKPKQLYTEMPVVWFVPVRNRKIPETGVYNCPIYKVLSRSGTLSTTGHSTNFCLMIELPSDRD